jgi:hypothetical protein
LAEKEMPQVHLDTQYLRKYDERALGVLYRSIEFLRKKPLTRHEVLGIYEEGIAVIFTGNGLNFAPELNYALFYSKVRMRSPVLLTLACFAGRGESHQEVIEHGPPGKLVVAGTVRNRTFTGVSTTWMKHIQPESGRHALGLFLNDLLLDYYHIERMPSWSDQGAEMWKFA